MWWKMNYRYVRRWEVVLLLYSTVCCTVRTALGVCLLFVYAVTATTTTATVLYYSLLAVRDYCAPLIVYRHVRAMVFAALVLCLL